MPGPWACPVTSPQPWLHPAGMTSPPAGYDVQPAGHAHPGQLPGPHHTHVPAGGAGPGARGGAGIQQGRAGKGARGA